MAEEQKKQEAPANKLVVEGKPVDEKKEADPNSLASSDLPYHTANTEKIAEKNAKQVRPDAPYTYEANGFKVTGRDAEEQEMGFADGDKQVYEVEGNGLPLRVYGVKRDAEIFCETHSPNFAKQSAVMPSV